MNLPRILALDVGDRTIGLALSDDLGLTAQGRPTLERRGPRQDLETLAKLVAEEGVGEVVVGLPLHLDGQAGPQVGARQADQQAVAGKHRADLGPRDQADQQQEGAPGQ